MAYTISERRHKIPGSIICDNGFARLRVIQLEQSLGLAVDAHDSMTSWVSLLYNPTQDNCHIVTKDSGQLSMRFHAFDPLEIHGEVRGVKLHGRLGSAKVSLSAILHQSGTWCHLHLEINPAPEVTFTRITNNWRLSPDGARPDISWPNHPLYREDLTENPAAFFQIGPLFAALIPDLEDGDNTQLGMRFISGEQIGFEYGWMTEHDHRVTMRSPFHLSYAISLDVRAMTNRGYQQVVRILGSHEALEITSAANPFSQQSNTLPQVVSHEAEYWQPFVHEGSPIEIISLTDYYLSKADENDWQMIEKGLSWLDRLCFHQRLCEIPSGQPFGSFGSNPQWKVAAQWMPHLLFTAFRLTGIPEYAYRGVAALSALPPTERSLLLRHLHPCFGDIYLDADSGETILFTTLSDFQVRQDEESIHLNFTGQVPAETLSLVVKGTQEAYHVILNGTSLGYYSTDLLRQGIDLPMSNTKDCTTG